jgi:Tetratricopeptide repeat
MQPAMQPSASAISSTTSSTISSERDHLPAMLATLCSYENSFGPYHPQTLGLMANVAIACWQAGEIQYARPLLERAVADLARHLDRHHQLRLRAIATLKDVLLAQREYDRAVALEKELLECQTERLGCDHPETLATKADLGTILFERITADSNRHA